MEDREKITLSDRGDQEPRDIVVVVLDEKEHATFKRNKTDLHMKIQISFTEAFCGFHKVS
jgi:DnaJ-class molecular chaperone